MLELEDKLARAEIIDISQQGGSTVKFGAQVKLVDEETEEEVVYQVVGPDEAEIQRGLLSISAPLGRALIGREAGDTVEVHDAPRHALFRDPRGRLPRRDPSR